MLVIAVYKVTVPWDLRVAGETLEVPWLMGVERASCHFLWIPIGCKVSQAVQVTQ